MTSRILDCERPYLYHLLLLYSYCIHIEPHLQLFSNAKISISLFYKELPTITIHPKTILKPVQICRDPPFHPGACLLCISSVLIFMKKLLVIFRSVRIIFHTKTRNTIYGLKFWISLQRQSRLFYPCRGCSLSRTKIGLRC